MRYLVTGGAGFIGSNFIHYMFNRYGKQIEIINVDKLTYAGNINNLKNLDPSKNSVNYIFEKVDITNAIEMDRIFQTYRPDYVVNFAAESHVDRSILSPSIFTISNVLGTQVLLDLALKYNVRRFHQISTDEVYGSLGDKGYFTENTLLNPRSPYSASKASADLLCKAYENTYGLPVTISRCSNNYGPFQNPEKLVPLMIHQLLEGKKLPIYGDGQNIRDWLHVYDHCSAVDLILHKGKEGEVYNVGGHNEWKNIDLVNILIEKLSELLPNSDQRKRYVSKDLISFVEDRKGHDRRYAIDPKKIENELGWTVTIPFEKGIASTIQWYLDNPERLKQGNEQA